jgi:hypothetical protein
LRGGCERRREKILSEGREWRRRRGDGREIISARLLMQSPWVGENDEREKESENVENINLINIFLKFVVQSI